MGGPDGNGKGAEASEFRPGGVNQVIGYQVKDSLEEAAPCSEGELQFFGNGVGENFLCVPHMV
jgi:hypothetical protein